MLRRQVVNLCLALVAILSFCSCSSRREYAKETFPVTGTVYVDDQPAAGVSVTLHDADGLDTEAPTLSTAITKQDGTFAISTFEPEDGAPVGDYSVTFTWGTYNAISKSFQGDKLKGKYTDPDTSEFKITVAEGESTEMGRIDLATK